MRAHQRYVPLYRHGAEADPLALEARDCCCPLSVHWQWLA